MLWQEIKLLPVAHQRLHEKLQLELKNRKASAQELGEVFFSSKKEGAWEKLVMVIDD